MTYEFHLICGIPSPLVTYDRRKGIVVKDRAAHKALKREEQARAAVRAGAGGATDLLDTIDEDGPSENDALRDSSGVGSDPHHSIAAMPQPAHAGATTPTVTDRWGNVIPARGYVVDFPDWVKKALESPSQGGGV